MEYLRLGWLIFVKIKDPILTLDKKLDLPKKVGERFLAATKMATSTFFNRYNLIEGYQLKGGRK
jgi:hypothetical protein